MLFTEPTWSGNKGKYWNHVSFIIVANCFIQASDWSGYNGHRIEHLWFDTSHDLYSLISYFDLWRSLIFEGQMCSGFGQKGDSEWNWNTKKSIIWYLTWLIFIAFIFWPPGVSKFWRSQPPGSSEVKNGSQNGIGTPKNLWLDT